MALLVRHPVEQKEVAAAVAAVRVVLPAVETARCEAGRQAGHELHQRELVAPLARQVVDLLIADVGSHARCRDLDGRRLRRDRHLLGEPANAEREVDRHFLADVDANVLTRLRLEAGEINSDRINARGQRRSDEPSVRTGDDDPFDAGGGMHDGDRRPGEHRLALINDGAVDFRAATLRERCGRYEHYENKN